MSTKKKYIIGIVSVIVFIAAIIGYREYNRTPEDPADMHAESTITAGQLTTAFEQDEAGANKKYTGHNLQVSGRIASVLKEGDSIMNVNLTGHNAIRNVSCSFDKRHFEEIKEINPGDSVNVIGYCTGFLLDVVMNRCALIKK